ncbi:hypothetical protein PQR34_47775 [Paraburkholderia sediminicola]|uniref:hypothetical protein n=1 Tax=Paraburkholderia sediminicola TaxID=458836 RepID=UPI0038B784B5
MLTLLRQIIPALAVAAVLLSSHACALPAYREEWLNANQIGQLRAASKHRPLTPACGNDAGSCKAGLPSHATTVAHRRRQPASPDPIAAFAGVRPPRGPNVIERSCANHHCLPEDDEMENDMTKAKPGPVLTPGLVMAQMVPGTRYSLHELARQLGTSIPRVHQALADCLARKMVNRMTSGKRDLYWVPIEDEIATTLPSQRALPREVLRGYDATHHHFRELCLASRRPADAPLPTPPCNPAGNEP